MDLKTLQNGSDIRGIALDTEEHQANLTTTAVKEIANGLVNWLNSKGKGKKIAIGHDSRVTGPELKQALITTFLKQGVQVIDVGLATTPAMFMATQFPDFAADASIMITASHLPYYFNGLKLFTAEGGAEKEDIAYILAHTETNSESKGTLVQRDLLTPYAADLVEKIRQGIGQGQKPLTGFHIIVDAGNGAGGFFADKVLVPLGADTTGSQFLEPDGMFPSHIPNPDNKEAMASIQQAVLRHKADLGVIFDTDVDRSAVVDQAGHVLNRNNLIAVLATIVLAEQPGSSIVTNSPTSSHLKTFIEAKGGHQIRYISGYRNVINRAIEANKAGTVTPLAIETSGHAAFKENYFLDDGAYVIAKILMLLPKLRQENRDLQDLIADLAQPAETQEVRFLITAADVQAYGQQVIAEMADFVEQTPGFAVDPENEEGIRVNVTEPLGTGWYLLRLSLHEPLLVLQVENDQTGMNRQVFQKLQEFFTKYSALDLGKLQTVLRN